MLFDGEEGAEPRASRDNVWEPLLRDDAQRAVTPQLLDAVWDPLSAAVATKQADAQQAQVRQRGSCPRVAAVAPARNNAHAPLIL